MADQLGDVLLVLGHEHPPEPRPRSLDPARAPPRRLALVRVSHEASVVEARYGTMTMT
jgi:hypothetical protein